MSHQQPANAREACLDQRNETLRSRAMAVQAKLATYQEPMLDMLEQLVRLESPSQNCEATTACLAFLRGVFRELGCFTRILKGPSQLPNPQTKQLSHLLVLPRKRSRGQALQLLLGHADTIWPMGTLQQMPFKRTEEKISGPGVFDMKAGLVQILFALKVIGDLGWELPLAPIVFINTDEEIGSRSSTALIEKLARRCKRALVLEPALGLEGKLKTQRKGGASFEAVVTGKAAHAGLNPEAGASAILEMAHLVQRLFALTDLERGISVNVGMVEGGVRPNMIAPESRAVIDVRVLTAADAEAIEAAILALKPKLPGVSYQIRKRGSRPPMEATTANQRLWQQARELGKWLGLELEQGTAGGGSDGSTTSLHTATLDGLGAVGDGAHAAHEHLLIQPLLQRTALLALLIAEPLPRGNNRTQSPEEEF